MEEKKQKKRGCLIPLLVILVILIAVVIGVGVGVSSSIEDGKTAQTKSVLVETMGLTEEQEANVLAIFEQCGILEVKEVTKIQAGESRTSFWVDDVETASYKGGDSTVVVWLDNESKTVEEIYFGDNDIYVDGQVVAQVPDFYVSSVQRDEYRVSCQMLIKQCLKYPDTAKFESASGWAFGVRDGLDVIQSTVTAKNASGVESSEQFQIKIDRSTGEAVSCILGGSEYIQ